MCFQRLFGWLSPWNLDHAAYPRHDRLQYTGVRPASKTSGLATKHKRYIRANLEQTPETFIEILSTAAGRLLARISLEKKLKDCETRLFEAHKRVEEISIRLKSLAIHVNEIPGLSGVRDRFRRQKAENEHDIEDHTEIQEWLQGRLRDSTLDFVEVMKDLYWHADVFLDAALTGQVTGFDVDGGFVLDLKLAKEGHIALQQSKDQLRDIRSAVGSQVFRRGSESPDRRAIREDHNARELRAQRRMVRNRIRIQSSNQANREETLLQEHAIPFLQECGKYPADLDDSDTSSAGSRTEMSFPEDLRNGWEGEPENRKAMRSLRRNASGLERDLETIRDEYWHGLSEFLFAHSGRATLEGWNERYARESNVHSFAQIQQVHLTGIDFYKGHHEVLRREADDVNETELPFSCLSLASRSGDGSTGSAPVQLRQALPTYLSQSDIRRKVKRWRRSVIGDPPGREVRVQRMKRIRERLSHLHAGQAHSVTPESFASRDGTVAPSIEGESEAKQLARDTRIERRRNWERE